MSVLDSVKEDLSKKFPNHLFFSSLKEVPANISLPDDWQGFGLFYEGKPSYPKTWEDFSSEFPLVLDCLNHSLICTLIMVGEKVEMIYAFCDANGFYYYSGGMPVTSSGESSAYLDMLPKRLQLFYRELHNGYTYLSAESMGPQKLRDQCRVSDLIDEEDVSYADNWITVFSNGAGDYVSVEIPVRSENKGLIWWHEDYANPEREIDIFQIMDAWMGIFSEGTYPREMVLSG